MDPKVDSPFGADALEQGRPLVGTPLNLLRVQAFYLLPVQAFFDLLAAPSILPGIGFAKSRIRSTSLVSSSWVSARFAMLKPDTLALTIVLALLTALGPLYTDMYLPSLPAIAGPLNASASQVQLTLSA